MRVEERRAMKLFRSDLVAIVSALANERIWRDWREAALRWKRGEL